MQLFLTRLVTTTDLNSKEYYLVTGSRFRIFVIIDRPVLTQMDQVRALWPARRYLKEFNCQILPSVFGKATGELELVFQQFPALDN